MIKTWAKTVKGTFLLKKKYSNPLLEKSTMHEFLIDYITIL